MKTKNFLLVILICLLLGSCANVQTMVLDESVPPEQRSRLHIGYYGTFTVDDSTVIVYDNKPVEWEGPNLDVLIPSGEHSFLAKYQNSGGQNTGEAIGAAGDVALTFFTFGLWGLWAFQGAGLSAIGGAIGSAADDAEAAARSRAHTEAAIKAAEEAAGGTGLPVIMVMGLPRGYLTAPIPNMEFAPKSNYRLREPSGLRRDWINRTTF
jgi:hypothetical protein